MNGSFFPILQDSLRMFGASCLLRTGFIPHLQQISALREQRDLMRGVLKWIAKRVAMGGSLLGMALAAQAQVVSPNTPGSIAGTVADPTGAVIPQASVTASRSGAATVTVSSDGTGQF